MKKAGIQFMYCLILCTGLAETGIGQQLNNANNINQQQLVADHQLFNSDEVLQITLQGNINDLLKDRSDDEQYHPVVLSYTNPQGVVESLSTAVKTRGNFRRIKGNCVYPPLAIKFTQNEALNNSLFNGQDKLKLVMPCRGDDYVIKEWLVYKMYNLVTPKSFKARLVNITFSDEQNKLSKPFYGFLLEDEKKMAERNQFISVERKLIPQQTNIDAFIVMAVFQYLIANTDWSIEYLQNIKLIAEDANAVTYAVPYDFDHAGIIDAPYAMPVEELKMRSLRERRYRGYCMEDMNKFIPVIALFNQLKNDIYALYNDCALLGDRDKKRTIRYMDDFYKTINNEKLWQRDFEYPCDRNGTGNVIIKGLKQ